ncbi:MAG TPA: DUF4440 domain-containing protein [Chryseolinea sp.]|nr:DUF4440 domain-containing protein [Chryseolinea sp.]
MKKLLNDTTVLVLSIILLSLSSCEKPKTSINESQSSVIDLDNARKIVDSLDVQFSKHYYNGDSIAIYKMYAKGAYFGSLKGDAIISSWSRQIRNSIQNDTRDLIFTTTTLNTDNEFLFETGKYEIKDSQGNVQGDGKYLLVWKQEDGVWKIYRDMGL